MSSRTVVPPSRTLPSSFSDLSSEVLLRKKAPDLPGGPEVHPQDEAGDDLPTKLVKYVPAETLAFFVPAAALVGAERQGLLLLVIGAAVFGTVGWLWYKGSSEPPEKRPLLHFYVLAVIAFAVWAIATAPNVAALLSVDEVARGVVLGVAVFLIPLIDGILTKLFPRLPAG